MAKVIDLKNTGLWTAPNDNSVPKGAQDIANNCVIDQKDLTEPRKGFEYYVTPDVSLTGFILRQMLATDPNSDTYDLLTYRINDAGNSAKLLIDDADTITGDNDFLPPVGAVRPRMFNWGAYMYVTSNEGLKRYSVSNTSSVSAGIPQALDISLSLTGSSGFFVPNEAASVTAGITNASATLSTISDADIAEFFIGQYVSATGVTAGTTISAITLSQPVVTHDATTTGGSTSISIAANTSVAVNQLVSGAGVQEDTRVVSISGAGPYTVVLTKAVLSTGSAVPITFSSDNTALMSANATATNAAQTVSLSDGSQIAYRLVFGFKNENDAEMLGAPSGFASITNTTGASRNVSVTTKIPEGISVANFYQLYRSNQTPTANIVPADQMQLVAEAVVTSAQITAGEITITDQTPDSLKGEALYTGTDQEGIQQSNFRPPVAVDVAEYRGYVLYGNYTLPHQLRLIIDGVGSPSGVQVNDEITITDGVNPFTVTAEAAEDVAAGEFQVFTSGTPSQNIADTAESFIRVVNGYASNSLVYARLISGPTDLPGQIRIEARIGIGSFTVVASANGTAWTPNLDSAQASENEENKNGLLVSKYFEPEAVPRINLFPAGGFGNEILRIIPLRDYVIVLTSEGAYRLTGRTLNEFVLEPYDLTVRLFGTETATSLGNECWCLSTQGIISISDSGVRIRSAPQVNDVIQDLVQQAPNSIQSFAFAVGYEAAQRFVLALPINEGDTTCQQQLVYSYITESWTRWTRNATAGYANDFRGLYLGNGANTGLVEERRNGDFTDYVDESFNVTIVSVDETFVELSSIAGIVVGDLLWQKDGTDPAIYAEVIAIDAATNVLTLDSVRSYQLGLSAGSTRILTAIESEIQWKPQTAGDPTEAKQVSEGQIQFRNASFRNGSISFSTDISPSFVSVPLSGTIGAGWGEFAWGLIAWGNINRPKTLRFYIPSDKQYCGSITARLIIRSGYSAWELQGVSMFLNDVGFQLGGSRGGGAT